MRNLKLLNLAGSFALFAIILTPSVSKARKLEFSTGFFNFSAENSRNSTSKAITGAGAYRVAYLHSFWDRYELDIGYSLLASKVIGGDLSFGFDIGVNYFFMSNAGRITAEGGGITLVMQDQWRPFVGISFNQRNFQSTSAQYAGGGLKVGTEYQLTDDLSLSTTARYLSLGGPNQSVASQIEVLIGALVQF